MTTPSADVYEKLASFYLGRHFDCQSGQLLDDLLMYDAKDLCTHALCVGMTGSGKTGLCISLLEEAALDGIPAICVDPKGDLANLLLTFPQLRPEDFKPWLEQGEATRKGKTLDELAAEKAETWREGLASWGQSPERIGRLRAAVDVAVYTPASNIGLPLTVLKSFDAPPPDARDDAELLGDRVTNSVSGLLTLMGLSADPMTAPEHILVSSILRQRWSEGKDVAIAELIRLIQSPPLTRIGVVDLDSFMSASDRSQLAMRLNNLLASPAFASWLEGESLSIKRLLHTESGKPRLSIISIAHLNDSERMFFVTILLNELTAWMRTQMGTSSLRAMFYMDEIAGYFPPVSNPPSKPPMLSLLKQARAFGLGITLATQNPVDLDYKGLSNIGTWFLGRLQTERDKARVLEGLEGASQVSGQAFDRGRMEQVLAGLGNRVFLMNNVHDGFPTTFQTRWAMSYLAGPLARDQISRLMESRRAEPDVSVVGSATTAEDSVARPVLPPGTEERFAAAARSPVDSARLIYRPAIYGQASVHYVRKSAELDLWREQRRLLPCYRGLPDRLWHSSDPAPEALRQLDQPEPGFEFTKLPDRLLGKEAYRECKSEFADYLYRECTYTVYKSPLVSGYAPAGDESDARAHFRHRIREERDLKIEKLRDKYEAKIKSLEKKIDTAEARVERERGQSRTSMISAGSKIVGALLGGFLGGRRTGVSTVARGVGYASQQNDDVRRAERALESLHDERDEINEELREDLETLRAEYSTDDIQLEAVQVRPRKSDLDVADPVLLWLPWQVDSSGIALPLW